MKKQEKISVIAVVGPTASGKTELGVNLAQHYNGEVVSADSMQIYRGMDIATAKPTFEEMQGIPHHLIGFLESDTEFNVASYTELAHQKIREISRRGNVPIVVGGTGLYISSLLENVKFAPTPHDEKLRKELEKYADENGTEALHMRLQKLDPKAAMEIHPNNKVRVIRAIEVCMLSDKTFSELKEESRAIPTPYNSCIIGLTYEDRFLLYEKINLRTEKMIERGLVDEAYEIWKSTKTRTAGNAIGYKELIPYFEKKETLESCIEKIKQETRRYAKRQLTWFRKNKSILWITIDSFHNKKDFFEKCYKIIAKSEIL